MTGPTRRSLLGGLAAAVSVAGCAERTGHDPILRLRNPSPGAAEVRIAAYRQYVGEDREETPSFEGDVSVDASAGRELEVFTAEDQYRVVV